jgi:outer membrane protein OmpA-like peptidoglycan-associated protein
MGRAPNFLKEEKPMLQSIRLLLLVSLALYLVTGCAPTHTVILVPDPDGTIGKAEVATSGGSQLLVKPNDMTHVSGPSAAPAPVTAADPGFIAATFADVLAIEPLPSQKFILYFESGTTNLIQESQTTIPVMVNSIKKRNALSIAISGHADASGSVATNDQLAFKRADMVKDVLIQNGIDPVRITVSSHGKGVPIVVTPDGIAEPRNRRVEVLIR